MKEKLQLVIAVAQIVHQREIEVQRVAELLTAVAVNDSETWAALTDFCHWRFFKATPQGKGQWIVHGSVEYTLLDGNFAASLSVRASTIDCVSMLYASLLPDEPAIQAAETDTRSMELPAATKR
ncbi:hypothetical protein WJX72_009867 [[Myrmecia] bisecta]|uniref:Uncharacterized protein n=1 Tax=[Myrmecia] bisecta TaxID=41462 RepID=A0AAW1QS97_9CHLO